MARVTRGAVFWIAKAMIPASRERATQDFVSGARKLALHLPNRSLAPYHRAMDSFLVTIGLGATAFAATDIDDLLLLIGLFSDPVYRPRQVVAGQTLGIAILYGLSILGASVSLVVPPAYVGLLGFVPFLMGVVRLLLPSRSTADEPEAPSSTIGAYSRTVTVMLITVANGGDNIATYVPLFATMRPAQVGLVGAVFAVMVLLWCGAALWLVSHRTIGASVRRFGGKALPYLLIGLGLLIVWRSDALSLIAGS